MRADRQTDTLIAVLRTYTESEIIFFQGIRQHLTKKKLITKIKQTEICNILLK